jgi:hypothetical protein
MLSFKEVHAKVLRGALYGGLKGGATGAAASLASGAAIVATMPAWLPLLGGTAVVALGTVTIWTVAGSTIGATVAAGRTYFKHNREESAFEQSFPSTINKESHER